MTEGLAAKDAPTEAVLYSKTGPIAHVRLNRPDKLNALNRAIHAGLREALNQAEADDARVLLLSGQGRAFSAGQDLGEAFFEDPAEIDLGRSLDIDYNPLIRRLADYPIPTISVVHGVAAGASANIALACDLCIAAEDALFDQAFVRIALMPDAGGTHTIPSLVGRQRALGLMLTGEPIDGRTAAAWGLVWQAYPVGELETAATTLAGKIAAGPRAAIRAMRRAVRASATNDLAMQLDLERDLQRELGRDPDFLEGLTAFKEKRAPKFAP